ncbi:MAG: hypothetical protein HC906_00125 [Bacteroidales bacterium]|nr:hypothetical protein [Bacteroidales bacterium]
MNRRFLPYCLFIFILVLSCEKIEDANPIPSISFKEFKLEKKVLLENDTWVGNLVFEFRDDDAGDIQDIFSKDSIDTIFSVIFNPFIKTGNEYMPADFDTLNYHLAYYYRTADYEEILKKGQNKSLKGDWTIQMLYLKKPADTIRYEFYMIDRDGNKSNVEVTTDIGFN